MNAEKNTYCPATVMVRNGTFSGIYSACDISRSKKLPAVSIAHSTAESAISCFIADLPDIVVEFVGGFAVFTGEDAFRELPVLYEIKVSEFIEFAA